MREGGIITNPTFGDILKVYEDAIIRKLGRNEVSIEIPTIPPDDPIITFNIRFGKDEKVKKLQVVINFESPQVNLRLPDEIGDEDVKRNLTLPHGMSIRQGTFSLLFGSDNFEAGRRYYFLLNQFLNPESYIPDGKRTKNLRRSHPQIKALRKKRPF